MQIRWAYNSAGAAGYSHYFWGLDDIRIFENPLENDLEITQVMNGDVFNLWEYRVTPMEQATTAEDGGLLVGTVFRNAGSQDQTGVLVAVEVLDEAGTVLNTASSGAFNLPAYGNQSLCPAQLSDTLYLSTGWVPTEPGAYTVRSTITSVETMTPDIVEKVIHYTEDVYGHCDEQAIDVQLDARESDNSSGSGTLWDPTGYASFTFPNAGSS